MDINVFLNRMLNETCAFLRPMAQKQSKAYVYNFKMIIQDKMIDK